MTGGDNMDTGEPLGMPKGSVRLLLSLGVVIGAFAIAAYLLAADTGSDVPKVVIGGWIAALGTLSASTSACAAPSSQPGGLRRRKPMGGDYWPKVYCKWPQASVGSS